MNAIKNSYDTVPYTSNPFPQTHPDRLATIATLLGMEPPPVEQCRVLELGCAGGGNLIPMAYGLPGSEFTGIDLSATHITQGHNVINDLGLTNISLKQLDILDVDADLGQFDYIIAHGVYSWVPANVQDKILQICRRHLAANGVAYVSYNTYPGWRLHSTIRDMMLYHTRQVADPDEQITQARDLLDFLGDSVLAKSNPHASFLHSYVNYVKERFLPETDDAFLFHNELAEVNEPLYFYQFAERAAQHGLRYLADAQFQTMLAGNLPQKTVERLRKIAKNTIALEQYMDFLRNRVFRQTLLCHQEVQISGRLSPERLAGFYLASSALPDTPELDIRARSINRFKAPNGDTLATDHPVTKAAMLHLSEVWPQAVRFNTLLSAAYNRLNGASPEPDTATDMQILGANLLQAYTRNEDLVEFHVYAPRFVRNVSDRPVASSLARYQAQHGPHVTNMRHELIKLEDSARYLMAYLDGSWTCSAMQEILEQLIIDGTIDVQVNNTPLKESNQIKTILPELLHSSLQALANAALLVG